MSNVENEIRGTCNYRQDTTDGDIVYNFILEHVHEYFRELTEIVRYCFITALIEDKNIVIKVEKEMMCVIGQALVQLKEFNNKLIIVWHPNAWGIIDTVVNKRIAFRYQ